MLHNTQTVNVVNNLFPSVDHITHINNLENILKEGLLSHNNPFQEVDISNQEVNSRRNKLEPIHRRNIHDYAPFYFNPRNAMLYRNQMEHGTSIIVLGFNNELVLSKNALFTDGNAASNCTMYSNDIDYLSDLDWNDIWSKKWCHYGETDNELKRKMMSEILIYEKVEAKNLEVIYCQTENMKNYISDNFDICNVEITTRSNHVFF